MHFESSCDRGGPLFRMVRTARNHLIDKSDDTPLKLNLTPTDVLRKRACKWISTPDSNRNPPAVLLSTGSYNPIHAMHLNLLYKAVGHVEHCLGYCVLGAFISPSHHTWLESKFPIDDILHSEDRIHACEIATKSSNLIRTSSWEARQDDFVSFPRVISHINAVANHILSSLHADTTATVFYVCGLDHAQRCNLLTPDPLPYRVITVQRTTDSDQMESSRGVSCGDLQSTCESVGPSSVYISHDFPPPHVSSSLIRSGIRDRRTAVVGLDKHVWDYMLSRCTYVSWMPD